MKKGITPIIAVIILLLITVALAGMAWTFLSGYFSGMTAQNIQLIDYSCTAPNTARIVLRNSGTQSIPLAACTAGGAGIRITTCGTVLTVTKDADLAALPTIAPVGALPVGSVATFTDTCIAGTTCTYRLTTTTGAGGPSPNVAVINC